MSKIGKLIGLKFDLFHFHISFKCRLIATQTILAKHTSKAIKYAIGIFPDS